MEHKVKRKACLSHQLWSVSLPELPSATPTAAESDALKTPPVPSPTKNLGMHHSPSYIDLHVLEEGTGTVEDEVQWKAFDPSQEKTGRDLKKAYFEEDDDSAALRDGRKSTAANGVSDGEKQGDMEKESRDVDEVIKDTSIESTLIVSPTIDSPIIQARPPTPTTTNPQNPPGNPSSCTSPQENVTRKMIGDWILGDVIGEGSSAKVKLARHAKTHETVSLICFFFKKKCLESD